MSNQPLPPKPHQAEILDVKRLSDMGGDRRKWLHGAEEGVDFLRRNFAAERVVIYASLSHVLIHGVLAPLKKPQST